MKFGVILFPGTYSETDCYHVIKNILHESVEYVWHKETDLTGYDCVILPGGFSYGDYLRTGAIARFSPVMKAVEEFAAQGKIVLGTCNGFQILCESGLLPGVLLRNNSLQFKCKWVNLRVETSDSIFTNTIDTGQVLRIPISHGEGSYYADKDTIEELEGSGRILFRYCSDNGETTSDANPNGSIGNIAGITNKTGNVLGMMPHPERCCESLIGGEDGKLIFESMLMQIVA